MSARNLFERRKRRNRYAINMGANVNLWKLKISSENCVGSSDPPPTIRISPLSINAKPINNKM